jgi:hypothetical protein
MKRGGKNYGVYGEGYGWMANKQIAFFNDTCIQGNQFNRVSSCSGTGCYLAERYCKRNYMITDLNVTCAYGCSYGKCNSKPRTYCYIDPRTKKKVCSTSGLPAQT